MTTIRIRNASFRILHWLFLPRPLDFCQRISYRRRNIVGIFLGVGLLATPVGLEVAKAVAQVTPAQSVSGVKIMSEVNVWFVNSATGDDTKGDGTERSPFKTITRALQAAQSNSLLVLAPGVYSSETGETFPLLMKSGVTIQGNPRTRGEGIVIRGGGTFVSSAGTSQNITILGANQASLRGVTVTNPNPQGYGLWIETSSPMVVDNTFTGNTNGGISVKGNSAPTIRSNYFYNNGGDGIIISGALQAEVRENVFENNGLGLSVAQNVPLQSSSEATSLTPPDVATRTESEDTVRGTNQPDTSDRASEPVPATVDNSLGEGVESDVDAATAETVATQESNLQVNAQSPSPSTDTAQSGTASPIMSLRYQENQSSTPMDVLDEPSRTSETTVPPAPAVAAPETTTDAGSTPPMPLENASGTSAPTNSDRITVASPPAPAQSLTTAPQPSAESVNESNSGTVTNPPALIQPPNTVIPPQPTAGAEPLANRISAASFPVPSLLNTQNPTSTSRVGSTPSASPSTAGTPTPSPNASAAPQPTAEASSPPPSPPQETATAPTNVIQFNQPLTSQSPTNPTITSTTSQPSQIAPQPQETDEAEGTQIAVPMPDNSPTQAPNPTPTASEQTSTQVNQSTPSGSDFASGASASIPTLQPNDGRQATTTATAPAVPQGQRYRVLVEAKNEAQQQLVRSLVPGAFRTVFNGQPMMQAGLFSTRNRADEILQLLTSNGFNATIEPVD